MIDKLKIQGEEKIISYYEQIFDRVQAQFVIASKARQTGKDASLEVESKPTADLADRTENIIGPKGIANRFREVFALQKEDRINTIFQLFKEIIEQKWGTIPDAEKRLEQAVKTCLVLITEGVVVAPLDGVPSVKISKNPDGTKYVDIYFAGPIRAAGGTATVFPLILGDYARQLLELDRYKPTEEEIERYVEEITMYDEIISRQYKLSADEIRKIIRGCPVCINGEPTEEKEVTAYKDLERITTNRIRGGMCLVISEGIGLKAMKILSLAKKLSLNWNWLEDIIKVTKSGEEIQSVEPNYKFLTKIAAGRPIFAYPSTKGGFRLRYGKARNTGIMGRGIHPTTMHLLDDFIAVGTQLKIERPGKSTEIFPVDSIEGPIVLLENQEVKKINNVTELMQNKDKIEKILFLGDMLVTLGDFRKTAHPLMPAGYCEEWWQLEAMQAIQEKQPEYDPKKLPENQFQLSGELAFELSEKLKIPLHPKHLHFYKFLTNEELVFLTEKIKKAKIVKENTKTMQAMIENDHETKKILEKILLPHKIHDNQIVIEKEYAFSFLKTLGFFSDKKPDFELGILECLSKLCNTEIRDKAGTFIGARMGRPEAAKPRKMIGNPHCLFPVGFQGGSTRSINKAAQKDQIEIEIAINYCPNCKQTMLHPFCYNCNQNTTISFYCEQCNQTSKTQICQKCANPANAFQKKRINLDKLLKEATENLKIKTPDLVKGVKGLINKNKTAEPIEKGILRATYDLHVFRDATIRYEMLNAPLTHFKPKEIGTSIEKLKQLGYTHDYKGNLLENNDQTLELFPQDIIVNEDALGFFLKVTKFADDELEKFYQLKKFYKKNTKEEMIGELLLGLAPHTSAAVIGRIIGYSKARLCFAHPFFHLTKRRNCLVGKTPILIQNGRKAKSIQIQELDKTTKKGEIPLENTFAYTIDEKGFLKTRKVNALFKQKSPKKVFHIKTVFGREIEATANHKLLTLDEGKIITKKAEDLTEEDVLLSLSSFKIENEINEINLFEWYCNNLTEKQKKKIRVHNVKEKLNYLIKGLDGCWKISKKIGHKSGKAIHTAIYFDALPLDLFEKILKETEKNIRGFNEATLSYNKQKSKIPAILKLSKELGEVLGYFLADGWATTFEKNKNKYVYQICFVSTEKEITQKISKNIQKVFSRNVTIEKRKSYECLTLSGRVYFDLFEKILKTGKNAHDKRVPKEILNSNEECVKGVVSGYIVGDGHIDSNSIKVSSVNKLLINDFCLLLNRFDCFSHVFSEKKREINPGIVKEFYEKKGKKAKIKSFGFRLYSEDLLKIGKTLFGEKKKQFEQIKKTTIFLKKRTKKIGNFVLDKIKKIRKVKSKSRFVYDLIIEGEKNFIGGFGNLAVYDCDGDQDSLMLLMDALLNFSEQYLPSTRGGRMDAPLVFTTAINPLEIDDEAYEIETCEQYPLKLYQNSQKFLSPYSIEVRRVQNKLGTKQQYTGLNFTHYTTTFDAGPKVSTYITLKKMEEKIYKQAILQKKIAAVQLKDSIERVLVSHFLPDIIGNTRSFSKQSFRCTNCNAKYRRVPLKGHCTNCDKGNIILTISHGSIIKYLDIAKKICIDYQLSNYLKQRIDLIENEVKSIFTVEKKTQKSLFEFV